MQVHAPADLAQQLARMLLLFLEQHFELLVGDEPHVDEDLTDATDCHGLSVVVSC